MTIFFWLQTVKDADDALLQGGSAHYRVVDDDQIIHSRDKASVSDVVHMGGKVVPAVSFGYEGTQLDVLDGYLLAPYAPRQDMFQLVVAGTMPQGGNLLHLLLVEVVVQSLQHSVKSNFCRIGDEGEDGMVHIVSMAFNMLGTSFSPSSLRSR